MRIHFIDTSILVNILDIPGMNQDRETVLNEYQELKVNRNTFILPLATIIETGNHIAHIDDGNIRRKKGIEFAEMLHKIANDESPWKFFEDEVTREEIAVIANRLPDSVIYESGVAIYQLLPLMRNIKITSRPLGI